MQEIDSIDGEIRKINDQITTVLVGHQQTGDMEEHYKKFFALVGELSAASTRRIQKQESLLVARADKYI